MTDKELEIRKMEMKNLYHEDTWTRMVPLDAMGLGRCLAAEEVIKKIDAYREADVSDHIILDDVKQDMEILLKVWGDKVLERWGEV